MQQPVLFLRLVQFQKKLNQSKQAFRNFHDLRLTIHDIS